MPAGPVLAIVGEPTDAANFVGFHRGRDVRTVPVRSMGDVVPEPGAAPVHALVDDRVIAAVLAGGATDVQHGRVYSIVRIDPRR
jgi:hypothetical protein